MSKPQNVISNFIWRFAERSGAHLVALVVSVVLGRILGPEIYATVALITVFTSILQTFVDSGLGNALIQKKDADNVDFSTVFYTNIGFCSTLYLLFFFAAPFLAQFYRDPTLTPLMRVLGLTIVVSGIKNVQQAYVSRNLMFRKFFFATLLGTITAAVVGITLAVLGFGPWALVAQQLVNLTIDTVVLWITVKWRPIRAFSLERLKKLYSYGWKLLCSALLEKVYNNLYQLIIGKKYTKEDLAFYNRGVQFPDVLVSNINTSIDSVLLPVMSREQNNRENVRAMMRRSIKTSTYIIAPMMMGLAFVAEPLIRLLLTDAWLPSVPFMRIFCITYMFYPIHTSNLNAIKAMGRSDLFLKLEIIKKIVGLATVSVTMWFGVKVMAYSLLFTSVTSQIINSWPNKKLLNYSYPEQMKDILPGILLSILMGLCIYPVRWLALPDIVTLLIQVPLGAVIFVTASALLKLDSFLYLWKMVKPQINKFIHKL